MTLAKQSKWTLVIVILLLLLGGAVYAGYQIGKDHSSNDSSTASNTTQSPSDSTTTDNSTDTTATQETADTPDAVNPDPAAQLADACGQVMLSQGTSEGAAGTTYWHAVLTNEGDQDCSLSGYPVATMVDGVGVTVKATNNSIYETDLVTIPANGGHAHVVLGLPNPGLLDPSTKCTAQDSSVLSLDLPGVVVSASSPFTVSACEGYTVSALHSGI